MVETDREIVRARSRSERLCNALRRYAAFRDGGLIQTAAMEWAVIERLANIDDRAVLEGSPAPPKEAHRG